MREAHKKMIEQHPNLDADTMRYLALDDASVKFRTISNKDCLDLGLLLLSKVKALYSEDEPVIIDIEINGKCIFHYAMANTTTDNEMWVSRKKATAKHFETSSYRIGRMLTQELKTWNQKYSYLEEGKYAAHGGSVPIRLESGIVIGTATMSGLAQVMDHVLIMEALLEHRSSLDVSTGA